MHMRPRAADFRECTLEVGGQPVLHFASAYGFRNIQGLMRKVRLGRCEYDYIEVMACPAGESAVRRCAILCCAALRVWRGGRTRLAGACQVQRGPGRSCPRRSEIWAGVR